MSVHALVLPEVSRPAAGTTLLSEWRVANAEQQRDAAQALLSEWVELSATHQPAGFVQLSCFGSADGRILLSYAQWASDEAHVEFATAHRQLMVNRIDQAVPGIERPGLVRCRVHASLSGPAGADRATAAEGAPSDTDVVVVHATAHQPERTADWVDTTQRSLTAHPDPALISAHTLLSRDGGHAVLYAVISPASGYGWEPPQLPGVHLGKVQQYRLLGSVLGPGHQEP